MNVKHCFWLSPLLLGLDILSKTLAFHWVAPLQWGAYPFGGVPIFSNVLGISFSLNTAFNTGAAWGIFAGYPGFLFGFRALVVLALSGYLYFFHRSLLKKVSLWLIGMGAIGNAVDYLLYGCVIDFFHFVFWGYSFPIFNFADAYITLGVVGLLFAHRKQEKISLP